MLAASQRDLTQPGRKRPPQNRWFRLRGVSKGLDAPRAEKTRRGCAEVIASIFLPPPLVEYLKKKKILPASEIQKRSGQSIKFLDKFRKYLIASTVILDGDYPQIAEYVEFLKKKEI